MHITVSIIFLENIWSEFWWVYTRGVYTEREDRKIKLYVLYVLCIKENGIINILLMCQLNKNTASVNTNPWMMSKMQSMSDAIVR